MHRIAYQLKIGPITVGMDLDHTCLNRACCNPSHLQEVTHARNMELVRQRAAKTQKAEQRVGQPVSEPEGRGLLWEPGWEFRSDEIDPSQMIPYRVEGFGIMWHMVAPSEEDARAMVRSVWGPDFNFCFEEEPGIDVSGGYIHGLMFSWQERFAQTFERWKTTGIAQYWMPEIERQTIMKYYELRFKDRPPGELTEEDLMLREDEMDGESRARLRQIEALCPNSDQCAEIMHNRHQGLASDQEEVEPAYPSEEDDNTGREGPEWDAFEAWRSAQLEEYS